MPGARILARVQDNVVPGHSRLSDSTRLRHGRKREQIHGGGRAAARSFMQIVYVPPKEDRERREKRPKQVKTSGNTF